MWLMKIILTLLLICSSLSVVYANQNIEDLLAIYKAKPQQRNFDLVYKELVLQKNKALYVLLSSRLPPDSLKTLNSFIQQYNFLLSCQQKNDDSVALYCQKLDSVKQYLTIHHPQYMYFLLAQSSVNVKDIQEHYLHEKEAVIDFFVNVDKMHVVVITGDTCKIITIDSDIQSLSKKLISLIEPMYASYDPLNLTFDIQLAFSLYNTLVAPVLPYFQNIHSLIIIPDDILLGFPFECLVSQVNTSRHKKQNIRYAEFAEVDFMIKRFAISYNYFIQALNPEIQALRSTKNLGRKLLTMSELVGLSETADKTNSGWNMHSPFYGRDEVHRVSRWLWRHENLRGKDASADYLKNNCYDFRWIYLAIPCLLNNHDLKSSRLIFSKIEKSADNELTIPEILNCKIRADLITLSSSEARPVQTIPKIGVIGIPQSFLIAGVHSVLFSLWRINDFTSSIFMSKFYWELKYKRQTNSLALQEAKFSSIKDTFHYDNIEISRAHPYFWAPYILIGNANIRPPTFSTIPPRMVILIVYVVVIIFSFIIIRKTVDRNNRN